jgi:hypothetical protein
MYAFMYAAVKLNGMTPGLTMIVILRGKGGQTKLLVPPRKPPNLQHEQKTREKVGICQKNTAQKVEHKSEWNYT